MGERIPLAEANRVRRLKGRVRLTARQYAYAVGRHLLVTIWTPMSHTRRYRHWLRRQRRHT